MLEDSNLKSNSFESIFTNIHDNKDQSSAADLTRFWFLLGWIESEKINI